MTLIRKWLLLTAVVVIATLAAGWFLLVAPKRADAAQLRSDAAATESANERLVQSLAVLKAQQDDLPAQRFLLATLKTQLPENPALPQLIRDLSKSAGRAGVTLDSLAPTPPTPLVAAPVAVPVAPPSTETTGEAGSGATSGTSGDTAAAAAAVPAPVVPAGPTLYQVPVVVTVSGSYFELEQFVNKIEGQRRAMQVTGFTLTPGDQTATTSDASGNDLKLTLQSRVFISAVAPGAAAVTQPTPVASATAGE